MYKANLRLESFKKVGSKWELKEVEMLENQIVDIDHWKSWKKFDTNLGGNAKVTRNGECMYQYTTISPNKQRKSVYTRIGAIKIA